MAAQLRLRSWRTSSTQPGKVCSPRKISRLWLTLYYVTHVAGADLPELLPKYSCFLSLRSAVAEYSSPGLDPAVSSARSEGVLVELVAYATGRTLVELFATTVARPGARMLESYNEQSRYRPLARTQPIGADRSRCPCIAGFVRGHRTRASRLLW